MITLLLATVLSVKFPGGAPNEFAAALADATQQNVVLSQGDARKVAKAEFETADFGEMARALRSQTEHIVMPGTDLVISDQMLARKLVVGAVFRGGAAAEEAQVLEGRIRMRAEDMQVANMPPPPPGMMPVNFIGLPPAAIKDGKITFKTERSDALQLQALNGQLSKEVKFHWIYTETPVFVQVKDMPELDFMKWMAKAIGARLISAGKEYNFELDPIEIRKRAIATIGQAPTPQFRSRADNAPARPQDPSAEQAKKFRIACLNGVSPAQLTEALSSNSGSARIELTPRNSLTNLAVGRVRELETYQRNLPADSPAPRNAIGVLQRVDPNRSAFLILDAKFNCRLEIPVVDGNGRPAGVVRM